MTIRELAEIAGCSHTTVSKALRNDPKISKLVRDRVQDLAQKHGYQRDPLVSALMGKLRQKRLNRNTEVIGYINWWDTEAGDRINLLGRDQERGMHQRAKELGYKIEYFWGHQPNLSPQRLSRILYNRGIRGIILSTILDEVDYPDMEWDHFSIASLQDTLFSPHFHSVAYSKYHGMLIALKKLRSLGYSRIGFTNHSFDENFTEGQWLAAYLKEAYMTYGKIKIPPLIIDPWDKGIFEKWVKENKPDSIVCNSSQPLEYLNELGYKVPEDIAFVFLDLTQTKAPAAGISQPRDQVGSKVVELIVEQLETNSFGIPKVPKSVTIEGTWVDGTTVVKKRV